MNQSLSPYETLFWGYIHPTAVICIKNIFEFNSYWKFNAYFVWKTCYFIRTHIWVTIRGLVFFLKYNFNIHSNNYSQIQLKLNQTSLKTSCYFVLSLYDLYFFKQNSLHLPINKNGHIHMLTTSAAKMQQSA